jgi:hypothetical protein
MRDCLGQMTINVVPDWRGSHATVMEVGQSGNERYPSKHVNTLSRKVMFLKVSSQRTVRHVTS